MRTMMLFATSALCALSACAYGPSPNLEPVTTPGPLAQATAGTPEQVAVAAAVVLEQYGFPAGAVEAERGRVMSGEVVVQERWLDAPIEARLLCGAPYTRIGSFGERSYDRERALRLTRAIPVALRIGFEAEPRQGGSSTRLVVEAAGRPAAVSPLQAAEVACLPTQHFVDELFDALSTALTRA